jgi:alpha,alpha-trehalose-phosphate synthase [UDP-forming]
MNLERRLIIVSNRLPVTMERGPHGCKAHPSCGGLVSALLPIFRTAGGSWVGWPGTELDSQVEAALRAASERHCSYEPVFLTSEERAFFYHGCSNEILWPLFHDLPSPCNFDPAYWTAYGQVTEKFADAVEQVALANDFVWVHDYHLMLLADALRARNTQCALAYFHHVPFPAPDTFEKLPWRYEVLRGLMQFDKLGFQTDRDRRNFLSCIRRFFPAARVKRTGNRFYVRAEGRDTEIGAFPISVDYRQLAYQSIAPGVLARAKKIKSDFAGTRIILGIDRLDYTKGILERLVAFRSLLEKRPDLHGRATLVQVVVPSRELIPSYRELRLQIEQLVSRINGKYGTLTWRPIAYLHRCVDVPELLALYRAAHVALITPIRDGMNLVAKEFCAARSDEKGVLVLSEFAGAASELKVGALLVNPYDSEHLASMLCHALTMSESEQRWRMKKIRRVVANNDLARWCRLCCGETGFTAGQALSVAV